MCLQNSPRDTSRLNKCCPCSFTPSARQNTVRVRSTHTKTDYKQFLIWLLYTYRELKLNETKCPILGIEPGTTNGRGCGFESHTNLTQQVARRTTVRRRRRTRRMTTSKFFSCSFLSLFLFTHKNVLLS